MARKSKSTGRVPKALRRTKAFVVLNLVLWGAIGSWYLFQPAERQREVAQLAGNFFDDRKQITAFEAAWDLWQLYYSEDFVSGTPPGERTQVYGGEPRLLAFSGKSLRVLQNMGYTVGYSDELGNPAWVAYRMRDMQLSEPAARPDQFVVDPRTVARVESSDYTKSGYDRGHMAPNYAIATHYGRQAQEETFRLSNISPQKHGLNAGLWKNLEQKIAANYPGRFGEVWTFVGPIFGTRPLKLKRRVAVPESFYMIVVDESGGRVRAQAFIFPQDPVSAQLDTYLSSINEIERLTGLDFLSELPDDAEERLEARAVARAW